MKNMKYQLSLLLVLSMHSIAAAPIHDAVASGDVGAVEAMLAGQPDLVNETQTRIIKKTVNKKIELKEAPLHIAVGKGDVPMATALLANGAMVDEPEVRITTEIEQRAVGGHYGKPRVETVWAKDVKKQTTTSLHKAARKGDIPMATLLIDHPANLEAKDESGSTPLYVALAKRKSAMAKLLIVSKANVNTRGYWRRTPLYLCAMVGDLGSTQLLKAHGATVNDKVDGFTALYAAVKYGHPEVAGYLIENGADKSFITPKPEYPTISEVTGRPLLHVASAAGHLPLARVLVSKGAVIDATDTRLQTALHLAASAGHLPVVKFLVSKRADVNAKSLPRGATQGARATVKPLDLAKDHKHKAVVKFLKPLTGLRGAIKKKFR